MGVLLWVPSASADDYVWSGAGLAAQNTWSNPANWSGGLAPAPLSTVGTLVFPPPTSSACAQSTPVQACFGAKNDLGDLSANQLQLDDSGLYDLSGEGITLGSGGLLATGDPREPHGFAAIENPLTLSTSQSWDIWGSFDGGEGVTVYGALSGATSALTVNLDEAGYLDIGGFTPGAADNEIGPVTVNSSDGNPNEAFLLYSDLNVGDGNPLTLNEVSFYTGDASTGPFVSHGSILQIAPSEFDEWASARLSTTSASLDAASVVAFSITNAGTEAGSDYSQISSTGPVDLGGAELQIFGLCPTPAVGQVYTLVSTTGTLTGTFANAPNGGMFTGCGSQQYRIEYNTAGSPQTVTATVLGPSDSTPQNISPPTISGNAVEGETLTATSGSWSNDPTIYAYQWEQCYGSGSEERCFPIRGADTQSYKPFNVAGFPLRVQVTASNDEGGTTATSMSTADVQETAVSGTAPENTSLPQIVGTALPGYILTVSNGTWSGSSPQSYDYEWLRDGNLITEPNGDPAVSSVYVVSIADKGHQLSARVYAGNQVGHNSATTASVTVPGEKQGGGEEHVGGKEESSNKGGGQPSGEALGGGASPPGNSMLGPSVISSAQLKTSLARQLPPAGASPKIAALLRNDGLTISFNALEGGSLVVDWYESARGAKTAAKGKRGRVLVASGRTNFSTTGAGKVKIRLTAAGKRMLRGANRAKLTAEGTFTANGGPAVHTSTEITLKR